MTVPDSLGIYLFSLLTTIIYTCFIDNCRLQLCGNCVLKHRKLTPVTTKHKYPNLQSWRFSAFARMTRLFDLVFESPCSSRRQSAESPALPRLRTLRNTGGAQVISSHVQLRKVFLAPQPRRQGAKETLPNQSPSFRMIPGTTFSGSIRVTTIAGIPGIRPQTHRDSENDAPLGSMSLSRTGSSFRRRGPQITGDERRGHRVTSRGAQIVPRLGQCCAPR